MSGFILSASLGGTTHYVAELARYGFDVARWTEDASQALLVPNALPAGFTLANGIGLTATAVTGVRTPGAKTIT